MESTDDKTLPTFKWELGERVSFEQSDECGLVVGRAEYLTSEPSYYVRYQAADGRQVEQWWGQSALTFYV